MIKTAAQLLAEIGDEPDIDHMAESKRTWSYPANRRKAGDPPLPCLNAYRGCTGFYGRRPGETRSKSNCGHGWCSNCYQRWRIYGDSWYHHPNLIKCTKPNCFLGHRKKKE